MNQNLNPHLTAEPCPLSDADWLARAERFFAGWNSRLFETRVQQGVGWLDLTPADQNRYRVYLSARHQRDGSMLWVVESEGFILGPIGTTGALAFCHEPLPSYIDAEWLAHTRHRTKEDALAAFKQFLNQPWNPYGDHDPEDA